MITKILLLVSFITFGSVVFAEEAVPAPAMNSTDLTQSFQREYVYLASQKEALTKQKARLQQSYTQRISSAKAQTESMQKELVRLTSENDDSHEYLSNLERRKKELQKKGSSLEATFKKANKDLAEFKAGLHFETLQTKPDAAVSDELKMADFEKLVEQSRQLLTSAASVESFPSSFIDMKDQLVQGTITRIGRSAAIGTYDGQHFILGPNGEGLLKALEVSEAPNKVSLHVYIFESLNKMAKMKKAGGFTETLADLSPILFLATMLLLVLGLFVALIKV